MPKQAEAAVGRIVAVIGMHRSGTSLATRALQALEVELGDNLALQPAPDNPKGHWEDRDVLQINREVLAALALQWELIGSADAAHLAAPALAPLVERARTLLARKASGHSAWAFKDPRTTRLWPFWRRVLIEESPLQPSFLWVVRHPRAVAQSLARRDGFDSLKSHLLWLHHNLSPLQDVAARPHALVDYDRMLSQPRHELERIAVALDLGPAQGEAVDAFIQNFLDSNLRHFTETGEAPVGVGVEQLAEQAYFALRNAAGEEGALGDANFLDNWRGIERAAARFADMAPRLDAATLVENSAARLQTEVAARLREEVGETLQEQVATTLRQQFDESSRRIDDVRAQLLRLQQEGQNAAGEALQQQVATTLRQQFDETSRRIDDARAQLLRLQQEGQNAAGTALQQQVATTLRQQFDETSRRIDDARAQLLRLQQEGQNAAGTALQQQVATTLRQQFDETSRRIDDARAQLLRLQQEGQTAAGAALQQQVATTLREQFDETSRRIDDARAQLLRLQQEDQTAASIRMLAAEAQIQRLQSAMSTLTDLLNKERFTVFKPLLRRAYRLAAALVGRLPAPLRRPLRHLRHSLLPRSVQLTLTLPATATEPESAAQMPALGQPAADRHDVLVFPVIDWHFRFQRPQHLAKQLAQRGHRVFYLSTTFAAGTPGFQVLESPEADVFLIQLRIPGPNPLIYQDSLNSEQLDELLAAMGELLAQGALRNLLAIVDLPFWRPLAQALPGCLLVYDCMDHHAGFATNSRRMLEEEDRLLSAADLVVVTSAGLAESIGRKAGNVLIRNAAEVARFSKAPERPIQRSDRPVAGYLGAIADWFDIDLVAAAARRFADWDFVLVGNADHCDLSAVKGLANLRLVGEVPYAEAAAWVHGFDIALIPFKLNELTAHTNPVKAYEYLAAGKPVVATALPEVQLMDGMAHVAENAEQFLDLLAAAMAESSDPTLAAKRREWAAQQDWSARAEQLEQAVQGAFPKVSVIVLTYNNLAFTRACLHSLEINSQYPDWELLLVDNASTDGTGQFLADYAERHAQARLIQNDANLGFAAGNNRGLEAANGDCLIILNNDTYVTPGWMLDLVRHLRKRPELGLVGPVTNNIGNEAKIDIHYADMTEMQKAAWQYTSKQAGEELETTALAFFCAAMPRSVYETVGGLDERFGLGFFEDDDYCNRVRQAGFKTAVAEDVFVHHHLSASFDQIDQQRRQALFERNKALYEEKWGPWTPHRYRE